jgi:hypothetical protein
MTGGDDVSNKYGRWTLRSQCGWATEHTEADRTAGRWEPGRGQYRPRDPGKHVRFCTRDAGHSPEETHEYLGPWR